MKRKPGEDPDYARGSERSALPLNREDQASAKTGALLQAARESGAREARVVPAKTVAVSSWVQWKCRYGCEDYGRCLTCPPYTPSCQETETLLREYRTALLLAADRSYLVRYLAYALEREAFLHGYHKAFGMGAGPCGLCDACDVHSPCKRPKEARPSMEACGIDVFTTARRNGFAIRSLQDPKDRQTSFGLVLLE